MAIGKPSKQPCIHCGGHDNNIVEPVIMHTVCAKHRKYFTKEEKIQKVIDSYRRAYPHIARMWDDDGQLAKEIAKEI